MKFKKVTAEWVDEYDSRVEAPEGERSRFLMKVETKKDRIAVHIVPTGLSHIRLYHEDVEQALDLGFSSDEIVFCAWDFRTIEVSVFSSHTRVLGFVEGGGPVVEGSYNRNGQIGHIGTYPDHLPGRLVQFNLS